MGNILLVEDDVQYAKSLQKAIQAASHQVDHIASPLQAITVFINGHYDLVISDFRMAEMDGIKLLKLLKNVNENVKSIILTAFPEEEAEGEAIDLEVDCFLSKDRSLSLLIRYINSVLNRKIILKNDADLLCSQAEDITVNRETHEVYQNDRLVVLTRKEYEFLVLFLENKNVVFSREEMISKLWTAKIEEIDPRVIDGHIKRLRAKLKLFSIISIRGHGYKWNE